MQCKSKEIKGTYSYAGSERSDGNGERMEEWNKKQEKKMKRSVVKASPSQENEE